MSRMAPTQSFNPGRRGMRAASGLSADLTALPGTQAGREVWFRNLPPAAQTAFINRIQALYRSLPQPLQQALTRHMISIGERVPMASGVDGYGPVSGLGQWAEMATAITALSSVGAGLYNNRQTNNLANQLQSNALNSDAAIVAARNSAAIQSAQIIADAQRATAAQAAQVATSRAAQEAYASSTASTSMSSSTKTIAIAVAGVAALGIVATIIIKKK